MILVAKGNSMVGCRGHISTSGTVSLLLSCALSLLVFGGCAAEDVTRDTQSFSVTQSQRSAIGRLDATVVGTSTIRLGDQIEVSVWGYPEFNANTAVKEGGTIVIPLIGDVRAAGLTKEEFIAELKRRLAEFVKEEPRVSVSLTSVSGSRVHVMGAVTRQDNYPVVGDVSLVEVITSAGGAAPEADLTHVRIYRNGSGKSAINVNLSRHMERGDIESLPRVRPGDTVFIPRQENLMRGISDFMRDALMMLGFFRILN
jgi:polysaccharide biosynthesis/export protein